MRMRLAVRPNCPLAFLNKVFTKQGYLGKMLIMRVCYLFLVLSQILFLLRWININHNKYFNRLEFSKEIRISQRLLPKRLLLQDIKNYPNG